jgi:hypothetical protein
MKRWLAEETRMSRSTVQICRSPAVEAAEVNPRGSSTASLSGFRTVASSL